MVLPNIILVSLEKVDQKMLCLLKPIGFWYNMSIKELS